MEHELTLDENGRFIDGVSGNPAGRPKGALNRRTWRMREMLADQGDWIMRKLIADAKRGRPYAMKLCVERLLPVRDSRVDVDLPAVNEAKDVAPAAAEVIRLTTGGEVTMEEGHSLLEMIDWQRRAIESTNPAASQ